jgi:Amt family ammonium transporter
MGFEWAFVVLGALLLRVGFAMHAAGMVRSKNSSGMVLRCTIDAALALLAFWAVGYALATSGARFFGVYWRGVLGVSEPEGYHAALFAGVLISTGIVPGVLAERARFWPTMFVSIVQAAIVVPIAMMWIGDNGWLGRLNLDDNGAVLLHYTGAIAAMAGAIFVGPRGGKFNRDGSSTAIPGHSVPLASISALVMVGGFAMFIVPAGGRAVINTLLCGAAGAVAAVVFCQYRYSKPDIHLTLSGMIGALVAATAGPAQIGSGAAVLIGAVAGVLVPVSILMLDILFRIDDPTGGISMHGIAAAWGTIATAILRNPATIGERFKHLGVSLLALLVIGFLTVMISVGLWSILKGAATIRAGDADEFDGLDLVEHDIGAYPDFQQNTIKSYHLREM